MCVRKSIYNTVQQYKPDGNLKPKLRCREQIPHWIITLLVQSDYVELTI